MLSRQLNAPTDNNTARDRYSLTIMPVRCQYDAPFHINISGQNYSFKLSPAQQQRALQIEWVQDV